MSFPSCSDADILIVGAGPTRRSEFAIANRVAERFTQGAIHLAGDAAHVHAGIGARGMNLGIEDARVFAALYDAGRLNRYDPPCVAR